MKKRYRKPHLPPYLSSIPELTNDESCKRCQNRKVCYSVLRVIKYLVELTAVTDQVFANLSVPQVRCCRPQVPVPRRWFETCSYFSRVCCYSWIENSNIRSLSCGIEVRFEQRKRCNDQRNRHRGPHCIYYCRGSRYSRLSHIRCDWPFFDGLLERFWRKYDTTLTDSLKTIKATFGRRRWQTSRSLDVSRSK